MDEHFEEIERILTPWGPEEYKKFQNEIKFVTKQENGLYLSGETQSIKNYIKNPNSQYFVSVNRGYCHKLSVS